MELRPLSFEDVDSMWAINEQGLPGTGEVSKEELNDLLDLSVLSVGAFKGRELIGFVLCLSPGTSYASLNYGWFNNHFDDFIYVDRIAISEKYRSQGVGTGLYESVFSYSSDNNIPVAAEVNLEPPNPGSMRFHHRFGFEEVGILHHEKKSVTMLMRKKF